VSARRGALGYLWAHHRWAILGFAGALIVALVFAVRLTLFTIYWADPAHRDQAIEGWMTPRYVARSHDVGLDVIRAALPIAPSARSTLNDIAVETSVPIEVLIGHIEDAIRAAGPP
jgi:hypothetical protein